MEISRDHFLQGWALKDRNGKNLTETEEIKKRWQEYKEELKSLLMRVKEESNKAILKLSIQKN